LPMVLVTGWVRLHRQRHDATDADKRDGTSDWITGSSTPVRRYLQGNAQNRRRSGLKDFYVANPGTNNVSVVDIATMKETAVIPVGFAPSRNTMWVGDLSGDMGSCVAGEPTLARAPSLTLITCPLTGVRRSDILPVGISR
jgi:YVTN family beta-propeller protein